MDIEIVIRSDRTTPRIVVVACDGPLTFGRHPGSSVCLDDHSVSRTHARVSLNGRVMQIEDLSTNGTLAGELLLTRTSAKVPLDTSLRMGDFTVSLAPVRPLPAPPRTPLPAPPPFSTPRARMANGSAGLSLGGAAPRLSVARTPPEHDEDTRRPSGATRAGTAREAAPVLAPRGAAEAARRADVELRREAHKGLLENLDLATIDAMSLDDPSLRPKVVAALRKVVKSLDSRIPAETDRDVLVGELVDEALGLGPLEKFLADPTVSEIMVIDPETIYVEQRGKLTLADARFTDDERVRAVIERIVTPLGRRIDESSPLVDARLRDGSRVNAVIKPLALKGACITIRKFGQNKLSIEKLQDFGALTPEMGRFLTRSVIAKKNIVIAGGTGSGKTTLLNVLSGAIPDHERVVTIEDAAELQLSQRHVVSLETRPANMEGKGEYSIRDLVKNALRMRPDRIVVGECRGGEALDMLQAMNTGHDGSLTTTHANSPREAISRLETLCLMAGIDLPVRAIREQIASAVHVLVQQSRLSDGSRKVTKISEVIGVDDKGDVEIVPIFEFVRTGTSPEGKVIGEFRATGFLPSFIGDFIVMGLIPKGEPYL
jgi:pilus assembly protein CpaF